MNLSEKCIKTRLQLYNIKINKKIRELIRKLFLLYLVNIF